MSNNTNLVNILGQINNANRNKKLAIAFGAVAVVGFIGFVYYNNMYRQENIASNNYREKWRLAQRTITQLRSNINPEIDVAVTEKQKEEVVDDDALI